MNGIHHDKTDKSALIIAEAQKRFGIYGIEKTSMREIANDLHMTKGALYYYFPGKEYLYKAVIEKEQNEFLRKFEEEAKIVIDNKSHLKNYAVKRLSYFKTLLNLSRIRQESLAEINSVIAHSLKNFREKENEMIVKILEKGNADGEFKIRDPESTAVLFLELLRGLRSAVLNNKRTLIIDEKEYDLILKKTVAFTEIFINGLSNR